MPLQSSSRLLHFIALSVLLAFLVVPATAASLANQIVAAAEVIPNGRYYIRNVATGQVLAGDRNDMYPSNKGTPVTIVSHVNGKGRHTVMGKGSPGNMKCIAAQWSYKTGSNAVGAMYSCAISSLAKGNPKSSLETAKQAFLLVPASANGKRDTIPGEAQLEERSIFSSDGLDDPLAVDEADDIDVDELELNSLDKRSDVEKRAPRRSHKKATHKRVVRKKKTSKKAASRKSHKSRGTSSKKSSKGYGPFYIIASDHLQDQYPKALSNSVIRSLGQRVIRLVPWQKGSRNEQWVFIPA